MKNPSRLSFLLGFAVLLGPGVTRAERCEASVNGYKIRTVYITGPHFNAVVWAYKHLSDESCLTPVLDPATADAILEVYDPYAEPNVPGAAPDDIVTASCSSTAGSSHCIDSSGYEMDVDCDRSGFCTSYYGPSPGMELMHAVGEWLRNASYQGEARLFTPDHKLIWKSANVKGHGPHETLWMNKLRLGTMAPACKMPSAWEWNKYKTFRHWASTRCGIEFDPEVRIDIKANARLAAKQNASDAHKAEEDEMKRNAQEAASRQRQ